MSKSVKLVRRDKRAKLDLELFVIALIERGVNTPYALQAQADLSPGATIPVLARLEGFGFVRRGKPGNRGRIEYQVTSEGRSWLRSSWRTLLQSAAPKDIEAVLRTACLALIQGGEAALIAGYLDEAAQARLDAVKRRGAQDVIHEGPASIYQQMRNELTTARLSTDIKVLQAIAGDFRQQAIEPHGQKPKGHRQGVRKGR